MEFDLARIRAQKNSKLDNQKQVALTLEAVEETLKAQATNQEEATAPASYFAILMLLLEQEEGSSATRSAVLYLLAIIFPKYFYILFFNIFY
jgi:ribosomal RNA-processing protein 12